MRRLGDVLRDSRLEAGGLTLDAERSTAESPASSLQPPTSSDDVCPICDGAGFVRRELPLEHPEFGQAVPCRCVANESGEARTSRLQRYSNLGPLTRLTFDNLIRTGRSADARARERFQRCADDAEAFAREPEGWLLIIGPSGCGKTHLAAAVANKCLEGGIPALFVVVPDLLDHLRAAYKPDAEVSYDQLFEQVRNAPVLILDDLGTHSATPWAQEKLFQIINHRFNARLPTVVTTNVPLGKFDERLRTRLADPDLSKVHALEERRPTAYGRLNRLELRTAQRMTFESFNLEDARSPRDRRERENAHRQALRFAAEPEDWLVLIGGRPRDRTHLISAIANYRRAQGDEPLLIRVLDLLHELRRGFSEGGMEYYEVKQAIRDCPLLLLEDLEVGKGSEWSRDELSQMLDHRCLARLPTVITTPDPLNRLLTDPGWERLARLLSDPSFCSEVLVGESAPERREEPEPPRPQRQQAPRSRRSG